MASATSYGRPRATVESDQLPIPMKASATAVESDQPPEPPPRRSRDSMKAPPIVDGATASPVAAATGSPAQYPPSPPPRISRPSTEQHDDATSTSSLEVLLQLQNGRASTDAEALALVKELVEEVVLSRVASETSLSLSLSDVSTPPRVAGSPVHGGSQGTPSVYADALSPGGTPATPGLNHPGADNPATKSSVKNPGAANSSAASSGAVSRSAVSSSTVSSGAVISSDGPVSEALAASTAPAAATARRKRQPLIGWLCGCGRAPREVVVEATPPAL